MRSRTCCLLLSSALVIGAAPISAQRPATARRPIAESDLLRFRWVADPQISPDGRQVAYVLVTVDSARRGYETSVWAVAADGASPPRRLTTGPRDGAPRWSPDSRTLAFVRSKADARGGGASAPQLWLLSMDGGEGVQLTDLPRGASAGVWSPDGRTIAFTSTSKPSDFPDSARRAADSLRASPAEAGPGGRPPSARDTTRARRESDVRVITRAVFRFDNVGYLDPTRHSHIWTVPARPGPGGAPARATQLTDGPYDENAPVWSPDGRRIYFTSTRVDEPYYDPPDANIYAVAAAVAAVGGGTIAPVADINGPIGGAVPSPDGRAFAFTGFINPPATRSYNQGDLFVWRDGKAVNLSAEYDFDIGGSVSGDQAPPRGGSGSAPLVWSADGRSIVTSTTEHGRSNLVRFDVATGRREALTSGNHQVVAYTATPNAGRFALTISDPVRIGDLFLLDAATKRLTQLTRENDSLFAALDLSPVEEFWYPSFDGTRVEGWIMKPPGFRPGTKYPMILQVHGGPHVPYGYTFTHEFQWMAAKGYVVLFTNPRGSTSYGQEFGNVIQYRYPGDDYGDLMVAVDTLLGRGYVDESKLGITGGSGGGLLTNWAVTQTKRFAAAVSQRSVADWQGFWYTADFTLFTPSWFRVPPFEDPTDYIARSPVRYAASITTPLMLVSGEADYRTPPTQGDMAMFRALKALKKPTVLILFPDESHELSRSGQPRHRVERLQHIVGWFDKYLMGQGGAEYEQQ